MRRVVWSLGLLGAMACGLSVTGTNMLAPDDAGSSSGVDAASSSSSSGGAMPDASVADGGLLDADAGPTPDDFVDAGGCVAATFHAGATAVQVTTTEITVDADLTEWPCSRFSRLDRAHAGLVKGDPRSFVDYAVAWSNTGVYFACRVTTGPPSGTDDAYPYKNDSTELYFGGEPVDGSYQPHDLHLIVDWRNDARVYQPTFGVIGIDASSDAVVTAAKVTGTGFNIEGFIPNSVIGSSGLSAGMTFAFDVQLNDRLDDDAGTRTILWSYQEPTNQHGECGPTDEETACNTYLWGTISLM